MSIRVGRMGKVELLVRAGMLFRSILRSTIVFWERVALLVTVFGVRGSICGGSGIW